MIKDINAITPEYMKCRIEQETEQYKQEIERLNGILQTYEILLKSNVLEIERLNNIINELENFICDLEYEFTSDNPMWRFVVIIHNKLKDLKGEDKE